MTKKIKTIFLLAGRTGGPIMPLLATFRGILEIEKLENQNKEEIKSKNLLENSEQCNLAENCQNTELENSQNNLKDKKFDQKSQFEGVIIGVKNGFEEKLATRENLKLEFLPEAKLELLSFTIRFEKVENWQQNLSQISEFLLGIWKFIGMIFLLLVSFFRAFWLIWKYRPAAILSSGSFLAIPILWSTHLCNLVNFKNIFGQKILIITHQQDPIPGLASKLTFGLGVIQTCVFDYSKKWKKFQKATIIPNPLDFTKFENTPKVGNLELVDFLGLNYSQNNKNQDENKQNLILKLQNNSYNLNKIKTNANKIPQKINNLEELEFQKINNQKFPLFLIFGGGSGSEFINNWVLQNLAELTQNFRILHLSGIHIEQNCQKNQSKTEINPDYTSKNHQNQNSHLSSLAKFSNTNESNYFQIPSLLTEMPIALKSADLVMCRSGLGSISELLYFSKPAFLVPLENSHQEKNAEIVGQYFAILKQKNSDNWLETILQNYPQKFTNINYPNPHQTQEKLTKYYQKIYELINT